MITISIHTGVEIVCFNCTKEIKRFGPGNGGKYYEQKKLCGQKSEIRDIAATCVTGGA